MSAMCPCCTCCSSQDFYFPSFYFLVSLHENYDVIFSFSHKTFFPPLRASGMHLVCFVHKIDDRETAHFTNEAFGGKSGPDAQGILRDEGDTLVRSPGPRLKEIARAK